MHNKTCFNGNTFLTGTGPFISMNSYFFSESNIENISSAQIFKIAKKYQFLDKIFLRVLEKHPEKMPNIFFKMFNTSSNTVIKFLSNKSNVFDDLSIIARMPKWIFMKSIFK